MEFLSPEELASLAGQLQKAENRMMEHVESLADAAVEAQTSASVPATAEPQLPAAVGTERSESEVRGSSDAERKKEYSLAKF